MFDKDTKILIIVPKYVKFIQSFEMNLSKFYANFAVETFEEDFKFPHFGHELYHAFRKYLYKDRSYKIKLYNEYIRQRFKAILAKFDGSIDYILVIRPDFYALEVLREFKTYVNEKMVAYQWDGADRYSKIISYLESGIFDDFFVFDPRDIEKYPQYTLKFSTNFYFDFKDLHKNKITEQHQKSAYFIGAHQTSRYDEIIRLAKKLTCLNIKLNFIINYKKADKYGLYEQYSIKCNKRPLAYIDNLNNVEQADILVDLSVIDTHLGLSFRVFEALFAQKKLITNNPSIKNYEFYHPNNIFILQNGNLDDLDKFINLPFMPVDDAIRNKYCFNNWLRNILEIEPYIKIPIPQHGPLWV